jgi:hypothetical protein
MIEISIAKGYLIIRDEKGQIYPGWVGDHPPFYPELPEVDDVYQKCLTRNIPGDHIIDILLKMFHRQRIIRSGYLEELNLVLGLVGGRGAGKSCGAAGIGIYDFLLCGMPLISNMDIQVRVRYKTVAKIFKSQNLSLVNLVNVKDQSNMYRDCCLVVDEVNLEMGDARRSMANKNLNFSFALQQLRKRKLHIIHTAQSEMHCDERVRFQTSMYISCKDAAYNDGLPQPGSLGRKAHWKLYDTSGVVNGEITDDKRMVIKEWDFHNTPFWNSYNSWEIQTGDDDACPEASDIVIKDTPELAALKTENRTAQQIVDYISGLGIKKVYKDTIWDSLGITDTSTRTSVGMRLRNGYQVKLGEDSGGLYWEFPPRSRFVNDNERTLVRS